MRTAKDYPISLPYGSKEPPYGTSALPYHRGDDYAAPTGTPVVIGDTTIGTVGMTGLAVGSHCHVQEWKDSVYTTRKPQNAFKGGKVVQADSNINQQWGKHVTVLNKDGWNTTYAHLNKINVSVGQNISEVSKEENMKVDLMTARVLAYTILGDKTALTGKRDGDLNKNHVGKELTAQYISSLFNSAEAKGARANNPSEKLSKIREIVK